MHRSHNSNTHPAVVKQQYDPHNVWEFENEWNKELFDCKPGGQCCFACCCPCCMTCKLAKYLGESMAIGCCPGSLPYLRTKLRTARRIQGDCCGDTCATMWCGACAANQMANELSSQGLWDEEKQKKSPPRNDRSNYRDNRDYK